MNFFFVENCNDQGIRERQMPIKEKLVDDIRNKNSKKKNGWKIIAVSSTHRKGGRHWKVLDDIEHGTLYSCPAQEVN